mmetsp:Transcript_4812/g.8254  ORF Transcript_4812/g.8254 Transcript_4812/m.8254 type:complete len:91 (+) Transcript_4812:1487-1759(+)
MVSNIQCGNRHCVATFDYGAFFIWGDNNVGQLGNKKRSYIESPFPVNKFERIHDVHNIVAALDSTAVIVNDTGRKRKKREKNKALIKLED